jgi:hypothetical protein
MRARVGKIARLPEPIREELNQRLLGGALGKNMVIWLNELPEVKKVLTELFAGRIISEHNVSEWRHGGYQDWLRQMETRERVLRITEQYKDVESEARLGRRVECLLTAQLTDAANQLHEMKDGDARWKRLQKISQELCRLQTARCRGLEVQLQREKAGQGGIQGRNQGGIQGRSPTLGASRSLSNQNHIEGGSPTT